MRRAATVALFVLCAGCESDAEKLRRLEGEASTARLNVLMWEQRLAALNDTTVSLDQLRLTEDWLRDARDERTLAERELDLFLQGR